jgi:hypothetical protein
LLKESHCDNHWAKNYCDYDQSESSSFELQNQAKKPYRSYLKKGTVRTAAKVDGKDDEYYRVE